VKVGGLEVGSDDGDDSADAGGGDGVSWIFLGAEKIHSIYVGLHEQNFFT
jgi:hypothetical protein